MQFLSSEFSIKILSVQHLSWKANNTYVSPRPFNALSMRIRGNSVFSDGSRSVHLSNNDILYMPKNVGYHLRSEEEELLVIHFEVDVETQNFFEVFNPQDSDSYMRTFTAIYNEWIKHSDGYYFRTMSNLYDLLSMLYRHIKSTANPHYYQIKNAVAYMKLNFSRQIDIDTLCQMSGISNTYFRKLFSETYGMTPLKYINKLRIDYASELLATGYYSVEEVAEKCGFCDAKHFSTVFKNTKNISPSKYKQLKLTRDIQA